MTIAISSGIMFLVGVCSNFLDVMPLKVIGTRTAVTAGLCFICVVMILPATFVFYEQDVKRQCSNASKNEPEQFVKL